MRGILIPLVLVSIGLAMVIHVPGEQPTIQAGLTAAASGDTVLVAAGTYSERITWPARDGITLSSEAGPEQTIIDGQQGGRVILMTAMTYTAATLVQGFTITNGYLTSGNGAGVSCRGGPTFRQNRITHNVGPRGGSGGGVYANGPVSLAYNVVSACSLGNGGGINYGAGVWCNGSCIIYQNRFENNAAHDSTANAQFYGGALSLSGSGAMSLVFNNLFVGNGVGTATQNGIARGGAIYADRDSVCLVGNTLVGNSCRGGIVRGGAIFVSGAVPLLKNNIIVNDSALGTSAYGGGIHGPTGSPVFDYNDVWGCAPNNYYNCAPGAHAISADPVFAAGWDGPYFLSQLEAGQPDSSPCVDAGDTLLPFGSLNLDSLVHVWTTRTDSVPDYDGIDLGFHYAAAFPTGLAEAPGPARAPGPTLRVAPNPAVGTAVISYSLAKAGNASLRLYDVTGKPVNVLASGYRNAGNYSLAVSGEWLAAGVYLLKFETDGTTTTSKLILE